MKNLSSSQWKVYAELEEIPSTVAPPQADHSNMTLTLAGAWRSLLTLFCQELLYEEQIEFLERCIALNPFTQNKEASQSKEVTPLGKFQKLFLAVIMG